MKNTIALFKKVVRTEGESPVNSLGLQIKNAAQSGVIFNMDVFNGKTREQAEAIINEAVSQFGLKQSELAATFYEKLDDVVAKSRLELFIDQIISYSTTYGSLPDELFELTVPNKTAKNVNDSEFIRKFTFIDVMDVEELSERVNSLLSSGIALSSTVLLSVMSLIEKFKLTVDINEVQNKEAQSILAVSNNLTPKDPSAFMRMMIYLTTESTLLINNQYTVCGIKKCLESSPKEVKTVIYHFKQYERLYGLETLSASFRRFKNLFLAFKVVPELRPIINKLNKLAQVNHKTMPVNIMTVATVPGNVDKLEKAVKTAPLKAIIRTLNAINLRLHKEYKNSHNRTYRVRNGLAFVKTIREVKLDVIDLITKREILMSALADKLDVKGKTFVIPKDVDYSVPTSAKDFIGVIPAGTIIKAPNDFVVGVHWDENIDIDLHATTFSGEQIGWNSSYYTEEKVNMLNRLVYSGDMTSIIEGVGASELLGATKDFTDDFIVSLVLYRSTDSMNDYKLFVGELNKEIENTLGKNKRDESRVFNVANANFVIKNSIEPSQSTNLGIMTNGENGREFIIGALGAIRTGRVTNHFMALAAMKGSVLELKTRLRLRDLLTSAGATVVNSAEGLEDYIDLTPANLTINSILNIVKGD